MPRPFWQKIPEMVQMRLYRVRRSVTQSLQNWFRVEKYNCNNFRHFQCCMSSGNAFWAFLNGLDTVQKSLHNFQKNAAL